MQTLNDNQILKPSGLNNHFVGNGLPFEQYIKLMQNIIRESRRPLSNDELAQSVIANSPFSWSPIVNNQKNGVLLIHGLFDSPFYLRDLGDYFLQKGYVVRSVLLPGHGTVPGDLLNIRYEEWLKAVNYGLNSLQNLVENIYIAAYSIGSVLAIHEVLTAQHIKIKAMLLFAPAIKPKSKFKNILAQQYKLIGWLPRARWYQIKPSNNYAKYSCYALNAGWQACQLIKQVNQLLRRNLIQIPMLVIISADDETISEQAILSFFKNQPHDKNKLLIYSNGAENIDDERIMIRSSHFPAQKIVNFSHICMTISPNNPLLGEKSTLLDLAHYASNHSLDNDDMLFKGAANKSTLKKYKIARLSYNPDFNHMLTYIDHFLDSIV